MVKLALGMIVLDGMPFVEGVLETWYPYVDQIVVAEGPVEFWHRQGYERSADGTVECLEDAQDRWGSHKIRFTRGVWKDKLEMCRGWLSLLNDDITHVVCMDADEFMLDEDIETIMNLLWQHQLDSVGLRLYSFVGGFDHYLTGFEEKLEVMRFLRYRPGAAYLTHRPPTLSTSRNGRHLGYNYLDAKGVRLYHYSHVLPSQIQMKEKYYADYLGHRNVIPDYYEKVWKPWVLGDAQTKRMIEAVWGGIHDFHPRYRGECRSALFHGKHPGWIERHRGRILGIQKEQINEKNPQ